MVTEQALAVAIVALCVCLVSINYLAVVKSDSTFTSGARQQGHREFPFGNSREFLKFLRELRGIYKSFVFFSNFYC